MRQVVDRRFDEVYQLAADMGGAGYIFTGEHDADVMHNSATINLNIVDVCQKRNMRGLFYSSSACMYPALQPEGSRTIPIAPRIRPIRPRPTANMAGRSCSRSGCTSPIIATTACENRVARYHNIFGPEGHLGGRQGKGAGRGVPQGGAGVRTMARSRSGATARRPARSSISTNVSRARSA